MLPHRLYKLPAVREQYRTCLLQLLKTAWDEQELLRETDRMEALVKKELHVGQQQFSASLGKVRQFIRTRRATLETELATNAPDVDIPLKTSACLEKAGTVTLSFETTWEKTRPQNPLQSGIANLVLDWEGAQQVFSSVGVIATPSEDARNAGSPSITLIGSQGANLKVLAFIVQPRFFRRGTNIPLDGFQVGGVLLTGSLLGFNFELAALPVGTMKLLQAGTNPGDKVVGKIQADLYRLPR